MFHRTSLAVVVLAACGDTEPAKSKDPWAAGPGSSITGPFAIAKNAPWKLVVEDRGREPYQPIRYAVGSIDREVVFSMVDVDHRDASIARLRYRWTCTPCKYRMIAMAEDAPDSVRKDFEPIVKQVYGDVEVPPDGHVEVTPATMMTTTPSTLELFELAVVPLPAEPIGEGARWTVVNGPKKRTFTLMALIGDELQIGVVFDAEMPGERAHLSGALNVTLADPVAKGQLQQTHILTSPGRSDLDQWIRTRVTVE